MRKGNRIFVAVTTGLLFFSMVSLSGSAATSDPDQGPTREEVSELASSRCGELIRWDLDLLGEPVSTLWKADYAACVLSAAHEVKLFERIGNAATIEERGIGPQVAAFIEACAYVNHAYPSRCDWNSLIVPLGAEPVSDACGGVEAGGATARSAPLAIADPGCDPIRAVKESLCQVGICVEQLIGVKHQYVGWPSSSPCSGVITATADSETSAGALLNLGIVMIWIEKTWRTVKTSVKWDLTCYDIVTVHGIAWGGFMRQLVITKGHEEKKVCEYDGFERYDCGDRENEHWKDHALAIGEGTYDQESSEGDLPPQIMELKTRPGGLWHNKGVGSFQAVQLFDKADAVLSGSQDYFVDWEEAETFGIGELIPSIKSAASIVMPSPAA